MTILILVGQAKLVKPLLDVDGQWMTGVGTGQFTVFNIIKYIIRMQKTASHSIAHHLTKEQKWYRYPVANLQLEQYHIEGDPFVPHMIALGETGAWVNN
jgi:hypothetical protein